MGAVMKVMSSNVPPRAAQEVLVKLKAGLDRQAMQKFASQHQATLLEHIEMPAVMREAFDGELVRLGVSSPEQAITDLSRDARVTYAEPNHLVYPEPLHESRPSTRNLLPTTPTLPRLVGARGLGISQAHQEVLLAGGGAILLGLAGAWAGSLLGKHPVGMALALGAGLVGGLVGSHLATREEPPEPPQERLVPQNLDPRQWALDNQGQDQGKLDADVDAPEAWARLSPQGRGAHVIAVLDTGVDSAHPALAGSLWSNPEDGSHGFDAINGNHDTQDNSNHGTHCSGIIAANGKDGVYGISPGAKLMPIKFMEKEKGTIADAIKGLAFATEHGARVTSNSWFCMGYNRAFRDALKASPALHILAAGNNGWPLSARMGTYNLPNTVTVAASDRHNRLWEGSNYGRGQVDLAAPGHEVLSCVPNGEYKVFSGTSMATPLVAGVADLVLSKYPEISNEELKERLLRVTRVPALRWKVTSGGVLNAARAVKD